MKYTYIIALIILAVTLSSCFQKQEKLDDSWNPPTKGEENVSIPGEKTPSESNSGSKNTEKTDEVEQENTSAPETSSGENTESQPTAEQQQKMIDESVDELESVLTEDIINDIFSDVK